MVAFAAVANLLTGGAFDFLGKVLDKVFPDPAERAKVELAIRQADQAGRLEELKVQLQQDKQQLEAILAEANSSDPWTSRARPSFLYVIYAVILLCVLGAIIGIWWPAHVFQASENLKRLLAAIPESLWWLFGAGYLGYTGSRSFDKWKAVTK